MEKEFTRYKAQSKEEIDRNEKTMEEMEGKISEVGAASKSSKTSRVPEELRSIPLLTFLPTRVEGMQSPGRESTTVFRWVAQLRSKIWDNS